MLSLRAASPVTPDSRRRPPPVAALALLALALLVAACGGRGPQPIRYGEENCDYCRMTISDERFGAQAVSERGKTHKFDSIECLAGFWLQNRESGALAAAWVNDFAHPGTWVSADSARFVQGGDVHSPMGLALRAFADAGAADAARTQSGGELLDWAGVLALVERTGDRPGAPGGTEGHGTEGHGAGH